ncbi:MAG: flagellar export chaperone FliS [Pseudomonadales bacterium]
MNNANGVNAYRAVGARSGIDGASPERLVQLLLDGALERIAVAKGHMQREDAAAKGEQIGKAISIVDGLRASLDPGAGALADNLGDLYDYVGRRLLAANVKDDPGLLDEAAGLLREIKSAWDVLTASAAAAGAPRGA